MKLSMVARSLVVGLGLTLGATGFASAGGFEEGASAYQEGAFLTARRLWAPLAEAGDARAQFN
ncbi:MAG: sel1 repeat family protein, partial [Alphaproteobacteria bacterium]|nr:sel1 repeat family protein [Alphaproteobacteria bacterium]